MERLTKRSPNTIHENGVCCTNFGGWACYQRNGNCAANCPHEEAAWARLADYEDTDLTPEQVVELQEENLKLSTPDAVRLRKLEQIAEKAEAHGGIDHLAALDVAAMEGRLVILPCNIKTPIYLIHQEEKKKRKPATYRVDEYHIDHFTIGGTMIPMITACSDDNEWEELIDGDQQGREYFLTREEAEKALKEVETDG